MPGHLKFSRGSKLEWNCGDANPYGNVPARAGARGRFGDTPDTMCDQRLELTSHSRLYRLYRYWYTDFTSDIQSPLTRTC